MKEPADRPLLADIRAELDALATELREMAAARWELARLELSADIQSVRRLLVAGLVSAIMALTALPLLAVCLADLLDGYGHVARAGWLLIFGAGLLLAATTAALVAWRRFRRRFRRPARDAGRTPRRPDLAPRGSKREGGQYRRDTVTCRSVVLAKTSAHDTGRTGADRQNERRRHFDHPAGAGRMQCGRVVQRCNTLSMRRNRLVRCTSSQAVSVSRLAAWRGVAS